LSLLVVAAKKFSGEKDDHSAAHGHGAKENNNPDVDGYISNPYLSIAMARDSLRQREESKKKQAELAELEDEVTEMQHKTEEDRVAIQDLEAQLIKRRRRVEKCRRLADAQSNYKAVLEKMIRDAMHQ
jgi:TolA-binding protein